MPQNYPVIFCLEPVSCNRPSIRVFDRGLNDRQRCSGDDLAVVLGNRMLHFVVQREKKERESNGSSW